MSNVHILVVEDEEPLADLYEIWLNDEYTVDTVHSGEEAVESLAETPDVVLLDRRLPDCSGGSVLEEIREREFDCRVAMVSAVSPDVDVLEMDFDTYLKKPASEADLNAVVEQLLARTGYGDRLNDYFALVSKRATLRANVEAGSERRYQDLDARITELERQLEDPLSEFTREEFESVFGTGFTEYPEFS
jgi:DNA-binding response OmpR family regulator